MGYDVIGDIHGQADKLEALLQHMGYRLRDGVWRHPSRTAVFVGDFIDRGPQQLRTVRIARGMVESGAALAVMGNHELNAIAWHTPDPLHPGEYLRRHYSVRWGHKNRIQHQRFLDEVADDPALHAELIAWFRTLPLWLELPGIRVAHACWHQGLMDWLKATGYVDENRLLLAAIPEATREPDDDAVTDTPEPSLFRAAEILTKGLEIPLPDGVSYKDKDGIARHRVRIRWWDKDATSCRRAALMQEQLRSQLPDTPIPAYARIDDDDLRPVFFGHYWMTGEPRVLAPHAACVDYSAGNGGPLVAYRWDGETRLNNAHFCCAP